MEYGVYRVDIRTEQSHRSFNSIIYVLHNTVGRD